MRWPRTFYKAFDDHRDSYGETEYAERDMLLAFLPTLDKYLLGDDAEQVEKIKLDLLAAVADRKPPPKKNDPRQGKFDFYNEHVALGDGKRIKRGFMNADQVMRRKIIIDANHTAQSESWIDETRLLNAALTEFKDKPPETVIKDVLNEDGKPRRSAA